MEDALEMQFLSDVFVHVMNVKKTYNSETL